MVRVVGSSSFKTVHPKKSPKNCPAGLQLCQLHAANVLPKVIMPLRAVIVVPSETWLAQLHLSNLILLFPDHRRLPPVVGFLFSFCFSTPASSLNRKWSKGKKMRENRPKQAAHQSGNRYPVGLLHRRHRNVCFRLVPSHAAQTRRQGRPWSRELTQPAPGSGPIDGPSGSLRFPLYGR